MKVRPNVWLPLLSCCPRFDELPVGKVRPELCPATEKLACDTVGLFAIEVSVLFEEAAVVVVTAAGTVEDAVPLGRFARAGGGSGQPSW